MQIVPEQRQGRTMLLSNRTDRRAEQVAATARLVEHRVRMSQTQEIANGWVGADASLDRQRDPHACLVLQPGSSLLPILLRRQTGNARTGLRGRTTRPDSQNDVAPSAAPGSRVPLARHRPEHQAAWPARPLIAAITAAAIACRGRTSCAAPSRIASRGIPKTTQVDSSCAIV